MKRVAVFGASGFVGRHAVAALDAVGADVRTCVTPRVRDDRLQGSIDRHLHVVDEIASLAEGCDVIVNAAGAPDADSGDVATLRGANAVLVGLLAIVATRLGARLVHVSSAAVQGRRSILDDSPDQEPFSPYSHSKAAGERLALDIAPDLTTIYRPGGVHAVDRPVTRALGRLARSPLSAVAAPGTAPTPQALADNVGSAIAQVAMHDSPPQIVHHPDEGCTTAGLLLALGGRPPRRLPSGAVRRVLRAGAPPLGVASWTSAQHRRLEMILLGQGIAPSWLTGTGWQPPVSLEGWSKLGYDLVREMS